MMLRRTGCAWLVAAIAAAADRSPTATEFVRCKSRAGVYGAAWLSQASTLAAIPDFVDKEALEYANWLERCGKFLEASEPDDA